MLPLSMEWDLWFKHWLFCDLVSVSDKLGLSFLLDCLSYVPFVEGMGLMLRALFLLLPNLNTVSEQWISGFFRSYILYCICMIVRHLETH